MVFIHGELWRAAAPPGATIQRSVRVRRVEGLVLHVEPVKTSQ
jgi:membrane protein implicated in regulation of membrane protease activity